MIGYILLGMASLFLAVIIIRALAFTPKPQPEVSREPVSFDENAAVIIKDGAYVGFNG